MHITLTIKSDSAAEIAEATQALAGMPKDRLTWEERSVLLAAGWRWPGWRWLTPDGEEFREHVPADLERLRRAAHQVPSKAMADLAAEREDAALLRQQVEDLRRQLANAEDGRTRDAHTIARLRARTEELSAAAAPAESAPPIPGPTARDGVVGMLARHGWWSLGLRLGEDKINPSAAIAQIRTANPARDTDRLCIATLEALAAREACRVGRGVEDACAECAPGEQPGPEEVEALRKTVEHLKQQIQEQHDAHRDAIWEIKGILGAAPTAGLKAHAEKVNEALMGAVAEARENKDALERAATERERLQKRVAELEAERRAASDDLGARGDETLAAAAHRVAEALTQELGGEARRRALAEAREQGAAEMRERACDAVVELWRRGVLVLAEAEQVVQAIRALPISAADQAQDAEVTEADQRIIATTAALVALGVSQDRAELAARIAEEEGGASPEAAHRACLAIAKADGARLFCDDATELRDRIRAMARQGEAGERAEERLEVTAAPPGNLCDIAREATRAADAGRGEGDAAPAARPDREQLGREVHEVSNEAWTALGFGPSRPWGMCSGHYHEVNMCIGERLWTMGVEAERTRRDAEVIHFADELTRADGDQAGTLRETPEEIEVRAERVDEETPRHASWLRGVAVGIREGERRAAVQIPDLVRRTHDDGLAEGERSAQEKARELLKSWEADRQATLRLRASVERGTTTWARRDASALIRRSCMLQLQDAFEISDVGPGPHPDAPVPPRGGEPESDAPQAPAPSPAPSPEALFRSIGESIRVPEAKAPAMRIERRVDGSEWLVGAKDEPLSECTERALNQRCCHHLDGEHLAVGVPQTDGASRIFARWPIAPQPEPSGESFAAALARFGEDVKRESPGVAKGWTALDPGPVGPEPSAAEVHKPTACLSCGSSNPAMAPSWCDCRIEPPSDPLEAARVVSAGPADLHLWSVDRGRRIDLLVPNDADPAEALAVCAELLGIDLPLPSRGTPDRKALLDLAAGWEGDADRAADLASAAPSGSADRARHNAMDRGLTRAARDLRRLLDAPRGPGGLQRTVLDEVADERRAQDAKWGGPEHDDAHSTPDWLRFIADKTRKAQRRPADRRRRLIQIAALAVAAVESIDRLAGRGPDGPGRGERVEAQIEDAAERQAVATGGDADRIASAARAVMAERPGGGSCGGCGAHDGDVKPPHNAPAAPLWERHIRDAHLPGLDLAAPAAAPSRPALAAGQRWRDRCGFEITMRRREDISAGVDLDGVSASGALAQFRAGERAPVGWVLVADTPAPPTSDVVLDIAAAKRGPRIEFRNGAEVTVDSFGTNDCGEVGPVHGVFCTAHIDGHHVTETSHTGDPGSWHVLERWPIVGAPHPTRTPEAPSQDGSREVQSEHVARAEARLFKARERWAWFENGDGPEPSPGLLDELEAAERELSEARSLSTAKDGRGPRVSLDDAATRWEGHASRWRERHKRERIASHGARAYGFECAARELRAIIGPTDCEGTTTREPAPDWTTAPDGSPSALFRRIAADVGLVIAGATVDMLTTAQAADQVLRRLARTHGLAPGGAMDATLPETPEAKRSAPPVPGPAAATVALSPEDEALLRAAGYKDRGDRWEREGYYVHKMERADVLRSVLAGLSAKDTGGGS